MDEEKTYNPGDEIEFESGVTIRLKQPSVNAFLAAQRVGLEQDPMPQPPMVFDEVKGREEENPNNPAFRRELGRWSARTGERVMSVVLMTGTQYVSSGEQIGGPNSEDFSEYMAVIGIPLAELGMQRYIQWIKYIATNDVELNTLGLQLLRLVGVPEVEVKEAIDNFWSLTGQGTDSGLSDQGSGDNGDQV